MTPNQDRAEAAKRLLSEDEEFVKAAVRQALEEILEAEMQEALGAAKGERTAGRLGYRSGYYARSLVTRVGKIELRVPQDRQGRFRTELFERYQRSEKALVAALAEEILRHLADNRRGERLRDGIRIAIVGPPNAGKSSLLNVLARRDAAIVASSPGTTRDVIEVHLDLAGYPVVLADTAGLREAAEAIEREGVRRSLSTAQQADLKIAVFDGAALPRIDEKTAALLDDDSLVVLNKSDIARPARPLVVNGRRAMPLSARTGAGISALLVRLEEDVALRWSPGQKPALARVRHRQALERCAVSLGRIRAVSEATAGEPGTVEPRPLEIVAEDLRLAIRELGRITGRVDVEDILDVIFRDFCIGK